MKSLRLAIAMAGAILLAGMASAQQGNGHAVVTILPSDAGDHLAQVTAQDVKIKVNGKDSQVTSWTPLRGTDNRLELVFLIDGSARASLATQFGDITNFIKEMPDGAKIAIAYMDNGAAKFSVPFSSNAADLLKGLHLSSGFPGSNASPYFCLSDLAKSWPSKDTGARREVVMITDGVDNYQRGYDPEDPYVQAAVTDSVKAGLVVYSIYWHDVGIANSTGYETAAGQNLLQQVSQSTGGKSYWEGTGNPVSFEPYFNDLRRRLRNQYALSFTSPSKGKPEVGSLKIDLHVPAAKVEAPQKVLVSPGTGGL